jgi:CDP-2,3-bis-(O-geranylgeranyl)-sn-glycerol synthase
MDVWNLLLLVLIANGAPVLAHTVLGSHFAVPLDMGLMFRGQPLLGHSKTWRGVIISILATALVAKLLGYSMQVGAVIACLAMSGDVLSSFIKRRLNRPASSMAPFLDQVPESLLPVWVMRHTFSLDGLSVIMLVCLFIILELVLSKILYYLGIRKTPY